MAGKKRKSGRLPLILLIIVLIFPVLYVAISYTLNDLIAYDIENDLKNIPLPENTELVDSVSNAGKIIGNGNGMQYYGAIVVSSQLSLEELTEYYTSQNSNIVIKIQDSNIFFPSPRFHSVAEQEIENFDSSKTNYLIECWDSDSGLKGLSSIFGFDLRGH